MMTTAESQPTQQEQATGARRVSDLTTMLLPVTGKALFLPGVSVAEIVHYSYPDRPDDAPLWYYGTIMWRNLAVPLVSFELLNGQNLAKGSGSQHIAVLNNTGVSERIPFIAIVIQGIPRLVRANERIVSDAEDVALAPAERAAVTLAGWDEPVFIPDVSVLERALDQYLQHGNA